MAKNLVVFFSASGVTANIKNLGRKHCVEKVFILCIDFSCDME